jgi:hypothetical protein
VSPTDDHSRSAPDPAADERPGALADAVSPLLPPGRLEARVVKTLARRGLLSAPPLSASRGPVWRVARVLVAAAIVFVAGAIAGRTWRSPQMPPPSAPRFVLLLYDGASAAGGAHESARVEEYRRWARALAESGRSVSGEKLGDAGRQLDPGLAGALSPSADGSALRGFFIISAASTDDAVAVARTSPHLRHGGRIVVRPIDPT